MEAVDEGLNFLGESGKQMVFFNLERSCSIKKNDIPKKPEAFAAGLEKIFGAGAAVLEKLILKNLYSKLGLKYEEKSEYAFADYLKDVKDLKKAKENNKRSSFTKGPPSPSNSSSTQITEVIPASKSSCFIDFPYPVEDFFE
jgi:hypothetical protein